MATRFCTTATRSTPTSRTVTRVMPTGKALAESGSPRRPTWPRRRRRRRPASLRLATSPDPQHLQGIAGAFIEAPLEMGMRSGRVAGRADQADELPALELVAFLDADCQ